MKFLLFVCFFVSSLFALHVKVINDEVGNGKTALVKLAKEKNIAYKRVDFEGKKIKIFQNPLNENEYYALIPVSYYEKPAHKPVKIVYIQNGIKNINILHSKSKMQNIQKKQYM